LIDPSLVEQAREIFDKEKAGKPYVSPVPAEQKAPVPDGL
jgi:hypothetical protein